MEILDCFVHTNKEIHGKTVTDEFLLPDIFESKPRFIGMDSGNYYEYGLVVGTHRVWNEKVLLNLAKKVKYIGFFGRSKKLDLLKNYIENVKKINREFPDSIVIINDKFILERLESRKEFLSKKQKQKTLSKNKKESYIKLAKLCLNNESFKLFSNFVKGLADYDGHSEYYSTLNYVMQFLNNESIHFIMALDWKSDIRDLEWRISSSLNDNFGLKLNLPSSNQYPESASISFAGVLSDFKTALNNNGFQLGFIKTDGDEYIILVHRTTDSHEVSDLVKTIGYEYSDEINCT